MANQLPPGFTIKETTTAPVAPEAIPVPVAPAGTAAPAGPRAQPRPQRVPAAAAAVPAAVPAGDPALAAELARQGAFMDPGEPVRPVVAGEATKELPPGFTIKQPTSSALRKATIASQSAQKGIASLLGLPVDAVAGTMNFIARQAHEAGIASGLATGEVGQIEDPIAGSAFFEKILTGLQQNPALLEMVQALSPETEVTGRVLEPRTGGEEFIARTAEEVGAGIASLFPLFGFAKLVEPALMATRPAAGTAKRVGRAIVDPFVTTPGKAAAVDIALAGTAGVGAATAEQLAPGSPAAEMTGLLAGAVAPVAAIGGVRRVAATAGRKFGKEVIAEEAGEALRKAAEDPGSIEKAGRAAEATSERVRMLNDDLEIAKIELEEANATLVAAEGRTVAEPVAPVAGPTGPTRRQFLEGVGATAAAVATRKVPIGAAPKVAAEVVAPVLDASPGIARIQRILAAHYPQARLERNPQGDFELIDVANDKVVVQYGDADFEARIGVPRDVDEDIVNLDEVINDIAVEMGGMVTNRPGIKYAEGQGVGSSGYQVSDEMKENVRLMQQSVGKENPGLKLEIGPEGNVQLRNEVTDEVMFAYGDEGVEWRGLDIDIQTLIEEGMYDPSIRPKPKPRAKPKLPAPSRAAQVEAKKARKAIPVAERRVEEAARLVEEGRAAAVGEVRPTTAQATQDPGIALLEQEVVKQSPRFAGSLTRQQIANDEILRAELDELAPAMAEPAEVVARAVKTRVEGITAALDRRVVQAQASVDRKMAAFTELPSKSASNKVLREEMDALKIDVDEVEVNIWNRIDPAGKSKMPTEDLVIATDDFVAGVLKPELDLLPEDILTIIGAGGRKAPATLEGEENIGQIFSLSSRISTGIREAKKAGQFGRERLLVKLKKEVLDPYIDNLPVKDPATLDRYQIAKDFTKEKNDLFARTTVADLSATVAAGIPKVPVSETAQTFFKTGKGADEAMEAFMKATEGMDPRQAAKQAMEEGPVTNISESVGRPVNLGRFNDQFPDYDIRLTHIKGEKEWKLRSGDRVVHTFSKQPTLKQVLKEARGAGVEAAREENISWLDAGFSEADISRANRRGFGPADGFGPGGEPAKFAPPVKGAPPRPKAVQSMRNFIIRDLASMTNEAGELTSKATKLWLSRNRATLRQFPELLDEFGSLAKMQEQLDTAIGRQTRTLDNVNKGVARLFLERDPDKAVAAALAAKNPAASFRELRNLVRNDKQAIAGLRRAVLDTILAKPGSSVRLRDGNRVIKPEAITEFVKKNQRVLEVLGYKQKDIDRMLDIAEKARVNMAGSAARPSITKEVRGKPILSINQLLSRIYGIQRGVVSKRFVVSEYGARFLAKFFGERDTTALQSLLERALLDPEFAAMLARPATAKNEKQVLGAMRAHLASNIIDEEE